MFGGCELTGAGVIRSKCYPASIFAGCFGTDPNWDAIEPFFAGENLRSDGQFLYFTRNKEVRRIRNNSPPARHDFSNLGFEVVQVIQDLNNSIRLVEGKRTVVRAYARVSDSTLAQTDWFPNAQLRGWRNGVELPGPLFPVNNARITSNGDFNVLRADATRSFQFELPSEWVRSGQLMLRFTVNPNLAIYESGGSPLGNNSGEQGNLAVVQVQPPCFVFSTIHSTTAPNYWPWENADNFARIMERAKSMLPVPDIHIHPTTERVSDEYVCIRTCDGPFGIPFPCGFICNDPFDLTDSDDWDEALEELASYDSFDQNRPGCGRTHYVGAIHPSVSGAPWSGLAPRPGNHMLVLMNPANGSATFNSTLGGRTLAHEFGHNLARMHINQNKDGGGCGGSTPKNPDASYPFNGCTFGPTALNQVSTPMGFDMVNFSPIAPNAAGDLMSYSGSRWPSTWTYNAMLNALSPTGPDLAAAAAPPPGPYLLVRGVLRLARRTVKIKGCYSLPDGVADPGKVQRSLDEAAAQGAHGYMILKLDAGGGLLEETALVLKEIEDANEDTSIINQFITKPAGMAALQIIKGGVVLAECRATPSAPVVAGVTAVYDAQGPSLQISINANDADNDPLLFSIQFSNDDGGTWRTLRVNEGSLTFIANPRFLPGGAQCRVRVVATDGFNSAVATSAAFVLPGHSPEPSIGGVRDGQHLPYGTAESLLGFALDAEDGSLPAATLSWDLAGPTPRTGTGPSLALQGLAPGVYTATLSATDADNNAGTATLSFEILPLFIADGAAPVVDGDANDTAYASAATVDLLLSPKTKARFIHAAGNLYAAFTDLPYGGISIRGRIGLYVDVNASGETTAQAGDVAFYVSEDGVAEQYEGDGTEMRLKTDPSSGFKAVISRGAGGWNAEFRIAESLLGGWNHAARMGLFDYSATTIFALGVPIDTPLFAWWPESMAVNNPSTWAPAWFGAAPPAPANLPPVAKAEAPPYSDLNGPTKVTLNGSASFDPEGAPLTYAWTQLAGPTVTLENAASATPGFTADGSSAVTFRFQLVVNDGASNSAPAEVEVILSPVATQNIQLPPTATRQDDGSLTVGINWGGRAGDQVMIQASTDLVTWEDISTTIIGSLPVVLFTDAQAGVYPHRFYRLAGAAAESGPVSAAGTALEFDGADDLVEVPHAAALNAFPLTVMFWLKTADSGFTARGLVSKYADASAEGYSVLLSEGRVRAWYFRNNGNYVWDGGLGLDGGFVADGQWHHIAFVVDAAEGRLYVDGALASSRAWAGTAGAATTTQALQFGRYFNYPVVLKGELDEITLWGRALTAAEISGQMGRPLISAQALLGHWTLNEAAGDSAGDTSGYGHDGTLQNGPLWVESTAPILRSDSAAGNALQFDGEDTVEVPHDAALNSLPLTISAWIKTTQATGAYPGIITKYEGGLAQGYAIGLDQGRLSCWYYVDAANYLWDGGAAADTPFVADGEWHQVAYVVAETGGRVYVDGSLRNTHAWVGAASATTVNIPLRLGVYLGGSGLFFQGQLDHVRLWSRALNDAEIQNQVTDPLTGADTDLLGFWHFDESTGNTAGDSSGQGRDATLNGLIRIESTLPLNPASVAGTAIKFDGLDDAVEVAHNDALNAFPLTVAAWIKTTQNSPGYVSVANKYAAGSGNGYSLHIHNGRLAAFYFRGDGTSYVYPGDPGLDGGFIADGQWHHVAYVVDETGGRIYVNGVQTGSLGWTGTPGACTAPTPILFGSYPLAGQVLSLNGRLDEITLWNRALTTSEIGAVMSFKQTGAESGLLGYWPFDDNTGATASDLTGNGYDAALQNGPAWVPSDAPIYP